MCVRMCVFCLVCKLKEWKLACVFIDYIEHWAQSQKASSFKFSNTVTASTPQRWCEPHYTRKLLTMRELESCALEIFLHTKSFHQVSSSLVGWKCKMTSPDFGPQVESKSTFTESMVTWFKGALSNCLYHIWLPTAYRICRVLLRITIAHRSPL